MHQRDTSLQQPFFRRLARRAVRAAGIAAVSVGCAHAANSPAPAADAIKAFKLCTGADNASHVLEGTLDQHARTEVTAVHFKHSPAHASYDWHNDPEPQFVTTLSGTLAFATRTGEQFTLHPGEVLVAEDNTGSGHRWRLIDDQPWRREYVVLKPGAPDAFIPDDPAAAKRCKAP
jgi:quercetin dioxygenase-like cupin family protein